MANPKFQQHLEKLGGAWKKAQERFKEEGNSFSGSQVPDGPYLAQLVVASYGESASGTRMQIAWEWTILEGEQSGQQVRDYDGLETEENLFWVLRKLDRMGLETKDLQPAQLPEILTDLVKEKLKVRHWLKV